MKEKIDNITRLELENAYLRNQNKFLMHFKSSYEILQSRLLMATRYIDDMHLDNSDILFVYDILNGDDGYYE